MAKKQKTTAQEWAARVKRWQRSGLSAPEIGRREGFDGRQLTYWKWRFGQKSKRGTPKKTAGQQGKPKRARAKAAFGAVSVVRFGSVSLATDSAVLASCG